MSMLYLDLKSRPEGYIDLRSIPEPKIGVALTDTTPYLYRISADGQNIGSQEFDKIVGGTVAWNQFFNTKTITTTSNEVTFVADGEKVVVTGASSTSETYFIAQNSNVTFIKDHVYLLLGTPSGGSTSKYNIFYNASTSFGTSGNTRLIDTGNGKISKAIASQTASNGRIYINSGAGTVTNLTFTPQLFDLTQMFGSTIADYILSLETANEGDGVAWFKALFPNDYYAYDTGTLMSVNTSEHKMVGKNLYNPVYARGGANYYWFNYSHSNSYAIETYGTYLKKGTYTITGRWLTNTSGVFTVYSKFSYDLNTLRSWASTSASNHTIATGSFTLTQDAYCKFWMYRGSTDFSDLVYSTDVDFQIEFSETATSYEPYTSQSYPLDSSLTLRGIPKLDENNKVYYDGDVYASDGTVTRKYGIVDLGTFNWTRLATSTTGEYPYRWLTSSTALNIGGEVTTINCMASVYTGVKYSGGGAESTVINGNIDKVVSTESRGYINVVDSAKDNLSASDFKSAMSGIYLVYELATPTTETADAYTNPQWVSQYGTEEYVDYSVSQGTRDVAIPVGHETLYSDV